MMWHAPSHEWDDLPGRCAALPGRRAALELRRGGAAHGRATSTVSRRVAQLEEALGRACSSAPPEGSASPTRASGCGSGPGPARRAGVGARQGRGPRGGTRGPASGDGAGVDGRAADSRAPRCSPSLPGYPRLTLELRLTNAMVSLVEEGFDLAFRAGPVQDAELVARRMWSLPFALAASPRFVRQELKGAHPARSRARSGMPAILSQARAALRLRRRDGSIEEFRPRERISVNDSRRWPSPRRWRGWAWSAPQREPSSSRARRSCSSR